MLQDDINSIDSSENALRKFGLTLGIFFGLISGLGWWRGHHPVFFSLVSVYFLVFGAFFPAKLAAVQKVWMTLGLLIGWVMTRVILSIVFFLIITPTAFIARLCRKDFLRLEPARPGSYWVASAITRKDKEDYNRQF